MHPVDPGVIALVRTEYVTSVNHVGLRALARKYGVSERTLVRYSSREGWPELRRQHWQQVAAAKDKAAAVTAAAAVAAEQDSQERSAEILRYIRDGLTRTIQEALQRVVTSKTMTEEEAAAVLARWERMAAKDILRFLAQGPQALASVIKALELVEGRPTERLEHTGQPIELTPEEEELVNRLWDQVRLGAGSD